MKLRPYQQRALDAIRHEFRIGYRRVILCAPTGAGKTVMACEMIRLAVNRGRSVLFLAHRRELIEQCSMKLDTFGVDHGILMAKHRRTKKHPVQVASIQTLCRRKFEPFDFVYVDECHRTLGNSYMSVLEKCGDPWVVGLSATPYRTDGKGLGQAYQSIVYCPGTHELTEQGHLVPVEMYAPPMSDIMKGAKKKLGDYLPHELEERINKPQLIGNVVQHWMKLARDMRTVVFCVSVAHAEALKSAFKGSNVRSDILTGKTPTATRENVLRRLAVGKLEVVTNCAVLTEGWDCPAVSCAVIARPTLSKSLWRQMAGRVLRTHEGKQKAIILDHGANCHRHGHIYEEEIIDLTEGIRNKRKNDTEAPATRICPHCYGCFFRSTGQTHCPYCGEPLEIKRYEPPVREGKLAKVDWQKGGVRKNQDEPDKVKRKLHELRKQMKEKKYKKGWLFVQLKLRYGYQQARRLMKGW